MEQVSRCRICGEVYFGKHPSHCPYCGAHAEYLVPIENWNDENAGISLSGADKANLAETQKLEYENTRFYRAAAAASKNAAVSGFFKYLARIENEHYNIACKLLGQKKDSTIFEPSAEKGSDIENLNYSKEKEDHASKLYADFILKSGSERLKTFFKALSEVEADHIMLDTKEIENLGEYITS